jgi:hypothetical protein
MQDTNLDNAITRLVAIAALFGIALIHILELPDAFDAEGYVGALFVVAIVASIVLAGTLTRTHDPRAIAAAGGLAGLVLLGYLISRTVGLPGFTGDVGEWTEPLGLASMVVEGLLVVIAAEAPGLSRMTAANRTSGMAGMQPGHTAG